MTLSRKRDQLGNFGLILLIGCSKLPPQRALLEGDADQDVDRHSQGEDNPVNGHGWCGPEDQQEADHHRVTHDTIEKRAFELYWPRRLVAQSLPHLTKAKQLEVVNLECGQHDNDPAYQAYAIDKGADGRSLEMPDGAGNGLPAPEQASRIQLAIRT